MCLQFQHDMQFQWETGTYLGNEFVVVQLCVVWSRCILEFLNANLQGHGCHTLCVIVQTRVSSSQTIPHNV